VPRAGPDDDLFVVDEGVHVGDLQRSVDI
jgi:hypothetical protein